MTIPAPDPEPSEIGKIIMNKKAAQTPTKDMHNYKDLLLDLLAILHRDGGHYVGKHGLEKAVEDAKILWYEKRDLVKGLIYIRDFVKEVEGRAEKHMIKTGKLEGAHYMAMKEILGEMERKDSHPAPATPATAQEPCKWCSGTGIVRAPIGDPDDLMNCPACHGTGRKGVRDEV